MRYMFNYYNYLFQQNHNWWIGKNIFIVSLKVIFIQLLYFWYQSVCCYQNTFQDHNLDFHWAFENLKWSKNYHLIMFLDWNRYSYSLNATFIKSFNILIVWFHFLSCFQQYCSLVSDSEFYLTLPPSCLDCIYFAGIE
jgi:hypothetical protein